MFEAKNPYISRINKNEQNALSGYPYAIGCSEEIHPMIKSFFNQLRMTKVEHGDLDASLLGRISQIAMHLALNTRVSDALKYDDIKNIKKIFEELDSLYIEALHREEEEGIANNLWTKLVCIDEIVCKNMVGYRMGDRANLDNVNDGKIFQSFESLWQVIHAVNSRWDELCERGFSLHVFYRFWDSFKYDRANNKEKTESEKLAMFMGLLDGTMKLHPQYECKAVSYQIVPIDFEGTLVSNVETNYSKGYQLKPTKSD